MNSELANNDIRQAIDEAVGRYYNNPVRQGATHVDGFGCYYKHELGAWYRKAPQDKRWNGIWEISESQLSQLGVEKL
ncbi:MAG: hypothetical protein MK188_16090 [Gammaproteobacteria bacterium]|nr:hypothetical protein [Gammaproteobacteria bacterium]